MSREFEVTTQIKQETSIDIRGKEVKEITLYRCNYPLEQVHRFTLTLMLTNGIKEFIKREKSTVYCSLFIEGYHLTVLRNHFDDKKDFIEFTFPSELFEHSKRIYLTLTNSCKSSILKSCRYEIELILEYIKEVLLHRE